MNIGVWLSYDGTRYDGWQKQGNTDRTIQGKLEAVMEKLQDIRDVMKVLAAEAGDGLSLKEKAKRAETLFLERAGEQGIELKLRRKPKK